MIYSYNMGSASSKALAEALGIRRLKKDTTRLPALVINWGAGSEKFPEHLLRSTVINHPETVGMVQNKLSFFRSLSEDTVCVPWTDDKAVAQEWQDDGKTVCARTLLRGSSGRGLVLCDPGVDIVDAPLYTKYIRKSEEYRIHVAFDQVIDVQKKIKQPDGPEPEDWRIRNHDNGFIFVRETANPHQKVLENAIQAMADTGLDFGAVDIIWNNHYQEAYVLEINTAPGLIGQTVNNYKEAFENALPNLRQRSRALAHRPQRREANALR